MSAKAPRQEKKSQCCSSAVSSGGEGADMKRLHVTGYLPGACPGNSKLAIDIAFLREVEIAVKSGSVS